MLRNLITGGNPRDFLISLLISLPIVFFSLSVHETAHGFVAYKLGDPTAHNLGRLTLNPLKHLDVFGFLCMVLTGFGWAKPVPIETRNFKKPRRDIALTAVAGPASNLILALIFTVILRFTYIPLFKGINNAESEVASIALQCVYLFIILAIQMNITLAVFNFLPIPPLDGSKILYMILPPKVYFKIAPYERYISLALALLLLFGILSPVISKVSGFILDLLFKLVGLD